MKYLKLSFLVLFLFNLTNISAQTAKELIGEWESKDSDGHGKYSLFEYKGKIYAYTYYWKGAEEEFSLEKEMEKMTREEIEELAELSDEKVFNSVEELLVLKDFEKKGNRWKGTLIYDEKGSAVAGTLTLVNADKLEVGVDYWGFNDKSVWTRIN